MEMFRKESGAQDAAQRSLSTTVLMPLGSLLVAGLGLLVQNVPWWVTAIVISYILIVALVVLIPAVIRVFQALRRVLTNRAIARQYCPRVIRFTTTLIPALDESRSDYIFDVWRHAASLNPQHVHPDYLHIRTLRSWLASIEARLKRNDVKAFEGLCKELAELVLQFGRVCEHAQQEIEAHVMRKKDLEDYKVRGIRQEWGNARDKHNQLLKAWEDLAKNINHDAGSQICFEHYGFLKTIE